MKTSIKILAASVALIASGVANASIQLTSGAGQYIGSGELFMTAFDAVGQQSYSRDLGIYETDMLAKAGQSMSFNMNKLDTGVADANWAKFISTGSMGAGVVFTVTGSNVAFEPGYGIVTTSPSTVPEIFTSTGTQSKLLGSANSMTFMALDINSQLGDASLSTAGINLSAYSVPGDMAYFDRTRWSINDGGKTFNTIGNLGDKNGVPFYSALLNMTDYISIDITKLPNVWRLDKAGNLTYAPVSAVPIPAAVWLFGSGLLGLAGIARRRKV